jgi:hypothetical protein
MARPCTDLPNTAVLQPSVSGGDGMSEGGRTSHVVGCSVPGLQANWPTTGATLVGVGAGVAVVSGAIVVSGVAVVSEAIGAVGVVVGVDVASAVGGTVDVGTGVVVSTAEGAEGAPEDWIWDVHPAAPKLTARAAKVTIEVR